MGNTIDPRRDRQLTAVFESKSSSSARIALCEQINAF